MGTPSSTGCPRAGWRLPNSRSHRCRSLAWRAACLALGTLFLSAAHPDENHRLVRVQIEWRSSKSECWAGVLETSQGTIEHPASLAVAGDEAGTLWADGKCLWLGRHKSSDRDGFEVSVIAPPSAHLSFTLQAPGSSGPRQRFECLLSDLEGGKSLSAKGAALQLSVRRAPGDALRIVVDRPHLIYHPSETFKATLVPDVLIDGRPSKRAQIRWTLSAARTGVTLKSGTLPFPRKPPAGHGALGGGLVEIPLPREEGPVSLGFRLVGNGPSEPRSSVQLLVLGEAAPRDSRVALSAETLIDRLTADEFESRRLAPTPLALHSSTPTLRAAFDTSRPEPAELTTAGEAHVDWSAVRLQLKHPQRPHRLVLHVAPDSGPLLGASLLEPDAKGAFTASTLNTGLAFADTSDEAPATEAASCQHEILFWPQVCDPVLLVHDLASGHRPHVTNVEIYELAPPPPQSLTPQSPIARPVNAAHAVDSRSDERLIGPYLARPLLPETFGGPKVFDARAGQSIEDWETFHAAARHVADYLVYHGYNSLLIAALSEGTTIYPSTSIEPTRRYDSGAVSAAGQIPIRKDFLELLHRVFDREHLTLIPELQFTCPLPSLERQLVDGAAAEGIELIGADGQSARERGGRGQESWPIYNPLDPRVQDAVMAAVREVVERYRQHPSFRGVALEISRTGYLQLPGIDWGCDSATVARFEHDTGVTVDGPLGGDVYPHRHAVLTGEARTAWVRWRCQQMAKFYQRLADTLQSSGPQARLVLACKQVLPDPGADEEVRHEIRVRGRLAELLADRGLDFSLLGDDPRVVVLKSSVWHASANAEEGLLDDALSPTGSFGNAFHFPRIGVLNYRPPRQVNIANFECAAAGQPAVMRLSVEASPNVRASRRRFVRALAETNAPMIFEGGWTVPLGQERATERLRQIARAIPPIPFFKVAADDQSAVVQIARHNKKTYIYAVNAFAQPFELSLVLSCPPGTACHPLGPSPPALIGPGSSGATSGDSAGSDSSRLHTSLDGYGLAAWEIDHDDARVIAVETQLPPAALAHLQARVARFQQQLALARRSAQAETSVAATAGGNAPGDTAAPRGEKGEAISSLHETSAEAGSLELTSGRSPVRGVVADGPPETDSLSPDDLRQLAKISMQLALAADEKRVAQCQQLLDSYWCRHLSLRADSSQPALLREAARPTESATR